MANRIQLRGGTAAEWAAKDPVLAQREPGIETDTGKAKYGDGVKAWTALPYAAKGDPGPAGTADDASVAAALEQPLTKAALSGTIGDLTGPVVNGLVADAIASDSTVVNAATVAASTAVTNRLKLARTIICAGDSLTAGAFGDGVSYPEELARILPGIPVYKRGAPGEQPKTIAQRQGGHPLLITVAGGSIPASGSVGVTLDGSIWTSGVNPPDIQGVPDDRSLYGMLNGIRGKINGNPTGGWTFTRTTAGSAYPTVAPLVWVDDFGTANRDASQIIWMGRNGLSLSDVRTYADKMIAYQTFGDFLILGLHNATSEPSGSANYNTIITTNASLKAAYPSNFLDIRAWLIANGLAMVGLTKTADDTSAISQDRIPPSLLAADGLHFNAHGYKAIAIGVQAKIIDMGWSTATPIYKPTAPLAPAGVEGYSHRYVASRSSLTTDAPAGEIPNEVNGGLPLANAVAIQQPILRRSGSEAWLDFDGVDDDLQISSFAASQPFSVSLVVRPNSTAAKTMLGLRANTPFVQMSWGVGKTTIRATNGSADSLTSTGNWHVITGVWNGATSLLAVDANAIVTSDLGVGDANKFSLGDGVGGNWWMDYDVAEVIVWGRALSAAEAAAVYTQMKTNHPTLNLP